jgi:hypothetical protein
MGGERLVVVIWFKRLNGRAVVTGDREQVCQCGDGLREERNRKRLHARYETYRVCAKPIPYHA